KMLPVQTSREYPTMSSIELDVQEMTCNNCVKHVTEALTAVAGVNGIEVDLGSGRVKVDGQADSQTLIAALDEAGYPAAVASAAKAHDGHTTCCGGCH